MNRLTIAQSIRRSSDPYQAAVASFSRRDCPHNSRHHTYYFEDGSFLTFEVSYMAIDEGQRLARQDGSSLWEDVDEFLSAIKPTESGASECDLVKQS